MPTIYTIGYATKTIETFISQLKKHAIDVVADIRSVPYSKVFYDYHRETLAAHLRAHDVRYVYLGEELGPRSKDSSHYDRSGQVQFDRLMQSTLFLQGIERLTAGVGKGFNIALLCAEKDPVSCHRSLLVGYYLIREGLSSDDTELEVLHIMHDGSLETQQALEWRLVERNNIDADLFMSDDERKQQAYEKHLKKNAYRKAD